jgi:23S rRNA pseudouridine1911/1915/1917 synthase
MQPPSYVTPDPEILFVTEEEEGTRIDKLLSTRFPLHSRTYFQRLLEEGFVLLNGKVVPKRALPEEGDEIEVCFQLTPETSLTAEPIPLEVLYEDPHLLVVNKPAGMVVHPAPGHWSGTFVNALLAHCEGKLESPDPVRPGIVHRLDKETSGVLIAAKTVAAHQALVRFFAERKIEKLYLALTVGLPPNGLYSAPIGRHPVHRKEMAVLQDGKEALSHIQVAAHTPPLSFVLVKPKTGRTHQIRVHLKHLGAPVLGDSVYGHEKGNREWALSRHMLHAYRLCLPHPITGAPLQFTAPVPEDMRAVLTEHFSMKNAMLKNLSPSDFVSASGV